MYKKLFSFLLLCCSVTEYALELRPWLEIKPSYFFFNTCPMNDIYNKGGFQIQGSGSIPFRNYFDFYVSLGYRRVSGHVLDTCDKTTLSVVPIDFGIKPIFNFCEKFYYFFIAGPRLFVLHQSNNSPYVNPFINSCGVGVFANTGFNVLLKDSYLFGIFGEYSYERKKICSDMTNVYSTGPVQVGGLAFGATFGYAF
ncbi:hypothetical protein KBB68_00720 [Candidatus Babeliales bacterium]|nr:hypothetical protein [Candidatus Babeliales bacterium]